ncbi:hypothetical protein HY570_03975, partial [Candidatus Micrarchaeota archaeon]|nr:hypothetical protein [Candidatus Micrarchaeota archaeon]
MARVVRKNVGEIVRTDSGKRYLDSHSVGLPLVEQRHPTVREVEIPLAQLVEAAGRIVRDEDSWPNGWVDNVLEDRNLRIIGRFVGSNFEILCYCRSDEDIVENTERYWAGGKNDLVLLRNADAVGNAILISLVTTLKNFIEELPGIEDRGLAFYRLIYFIRKWPDAIIYATDISEEGEELHRVLKENLRYLIRHATTQDFKYFDEACPETLRGSGIIAELQEIVDGEKKRRSRLLVGLAPSAKKQVLPDEAYRMKILVPAAIFFIVTTAISLLLGVQVLISHGLKSHTLKPAVGLHSTLASKKHDIIDVSKLSK